MFFPMIIIPNQYATQFTAVLKIPLDTHHNECVSVSVGVSVCLSVCVCWDIIFKAFDIKPLFGMDIHLDIWLNFEHSGH